MYVKFDKVAEGGKDNKGSCGDFIHYMSKEDHRDDVNVEWWFNQHNKEVLSVEVLESINKDWQGLGKNTAKFTTGSISPSEREWMAMGRTEQEREQNFKLWIANSFTKEFAANFNKVDKNDEPIPILPDNVKIFFKFEHNRYYKGTDEAVQSEQVKAGDVKQGFNKHVHFIVATKTADGKYRINPKTFNRREFNRIDLFHKVEQSFDKRFDFKRKFEDSFVYFNFYKLKMVDTVALGAKAFETQQGQSDEEQEREQQKQRREKEL